jgi:hypothetical protein
MAVNVKVPVFWDVSPCILVDKYLRFGGTYCLQLHIHGRRTNFARKRSTDIGKLDVLLFTMNMDAEGSSEALKCGDTFQKNNLQWFLRFEVMTAVSMKSRPAHFWEVTFAACCPTYSSILRQGEYVPPKS